MYADIAYCHTMHKIGKWGITNLHTEIGTTDTTYVLTMPKKTFKKGEPGQKI